MAPEEEAPTLHGFAYRFVPSDKRAAPMVLLLLHGTGGDEDSLLQLGRELSPSAALLSPRGKVLENGMPRFFRRLAENVFDVDDLMLRTHELADFVAAVSAMYSVASKPIVAVGYSNGANMGSSLLLLHPGLLSGAVLFRPTVPFVPNRLPDLSGARVLIAAGTHDPVVPKNKTTELLDLFRRCNADVTLRWESTSHTLTEGELQGARDWLAGHFVDS